MSRFKLVVAGCGNMARTWLEYALKRSDVEVVGLVDVIEANARDTAAGYGLQVSILNDVETAIRQTGANLLFDITIPETHRHVVTTALEGRKAETDCSDNIKSTAMVFAAIESARRGEKIPISL